MIAFLFLFSFVLYFRASVYGGPDQCDLQDFECQSELIDQLLRVSQRIPRTEDDISYMLSLRDRLFDVQDSWLTKLARTGDREKKLSQLLKWSDENWHSAGVKVALTNRGAALFATRKLKQWDKLINFRSTEVLSSLRASDKYSCLEVDPKSAIYSLTWTSWPLMLELAAQLRKPDDAHQFYVQSLPTALHMSQIYDLEDFQLLNHTILFEQTIHSSAVSMWMYSLIMKAIRETPSCKAVQTLKTLSLKDFQWAYMIVVSRQFNGGFRDGPENRILIPIYDLMNHDLSPNTKTYHYKGKVVNGIQEGSFETVVSRNVEVGEEITSFYGDFTADEIFTFYGFSQVLAYPLRVRLGPRDPPERKKLVSSESGLRIHLETGSDGNIFVSNEEVLTLVHLVTLQKPVLTPLNVRMAWQYLRGLVDLEFSVLPLSVSEIELELRDPKVNDTRKVVLRELFDEQLFLKKTLRDIDALLNAN